MLSSFRPARLSLSFAALAAFAALASLTACSSAPQPKFQQEMFDAGASPFSRTYHVGSTDACEAARRALLNQGYLTTLMGSDRIDATKDFQPSGESHITVEFHVVCTPGVDADGTSIVYANAIQSGYTLKKSDTSASVGLSLLGSVSLPIRSNSDAMVKVSSETIQSDKFYDRFFDSVGHYVGTLIKTAPVPVAPVTATTLPGSPPPVIAAAPKPTPAAAVQAASEPGSATAAPGFAPVSPSALPAPNGLQSPYAPASNDAPPLPPASNAAAPASQAPAAGQQPSAQPAPAQAASQ